MTTGVRLAIAALVSGLVFFGCESPVSEEVATNTVSVVPVVGQVRSSRAIVPSGTERETYPFYGFAPIMTGLAPNDQGYEDGSTFTATVLGATVTISASVPSEGIIVYDGVIESESGGFTLTVDTIASTFDFEQHIHIDDTTEAGQEFLFLQFANDVSYDENFHYHASLDVIMQQVPFYYRSTGEYFSGENDAGQIVAGWIIGPTWGSYTGTAFAGGSEPPATPDVSRLDEYVASYEDADGWDYTSGYSGGFYSYAVDGSITPDSGAHPGRFAADEDTSALVPWDPM